LNPAVIRRFCGGLHISLTFEAIPEFGDTYEARLGSSAFGYNSAKAAMGKPIVNAFRVWNSCRAGEASWRISHILAEISAQTVTLLSGSVLTSATSRPRQERKFAVRAILTIHVREYCDAQFLNKELPDSTGFDIPHSPDFYLPGYIILHLLT
jgi:hypothetical protein